MPELYEKELVRPGWYSADGGPTNITPARIARWEQQFQAARLDGFGFPTPWGHKLTAVPTNQDPYALDEQYARWNAGQMEWVRRKPNGRLYLMGTVPPGYRIDEKAGLLVNDKDGTVVRYVSPGFGDWVDGQNRYHKDALFHAALVTHPVQHEQEGFRRCTELPPTLARNDSVRFFSARGRVTKLTLMALPMGKAMADDNDADDKKKKKAPPKGDAPGGDAPASLDAPGGDDPIGDLLGEGGGGDAPPPMGDDGVAGLDATPPPGAEPPMPEDPAAADPAGLGASGVSVTPEQATQFVQILGQLGMPMLPGTNNTNIIERLLILLHAAANQGASLMPSNQGAQPSPLDLSTDGAQPDPNGMGSGMGMGGGPTFMSTRTKKVITLDPAGRALAEQAAAEETKAIGAQWDRLARGPGVPATLKAICLREKAAASTYFMSLNPDTGKVLNERARQKLWFAKELLAASGSYKILGLLSKGVAQSTPAAQAPRAKPSTAPANHEDLRNEIAARMGRKPEEIKIITGQPEA